MRAFLQIGSLVALCAIFVSQGCGGKQAGQTPETEANVSTRPKEGIDCLELRRQALTMDSLLLTQMEVNDTSARRAIRVFSDFVYQCRRDSLGPIYLVKTAQVARAIKEMNQARLALEQCLDIYPDWKDRAVAMMLLAGLYEEPSFMQDREKARTYYERVIAEFPGTPYAESAKGALQMLGKSEVEIIKELSRKKK